jgi:membrane protease YdiL (CAAX protease family)
VTSIPPTAFETPAEQPAEPPEAEWPQRATATGPRVAGRAGWRPWTAWAAILTGFGMTLVGAVVVAIVAAAFGASASHPSPGVNIGLTVFQNIALIGSALLFGALAGRPRAEDFGLRRPPLRQAVGLLLAILVGFYAISAIWLTSLGIDEHQTLPDELGAQKSTLNLALVVVLITVIAPLGEELFFRGYFFGALRNWKGWLPAAIITGIVFGAIHIGSAPLGLTVPLAFFGFGLCLLYQRTGSLYPCIALHAINNSVAFGLTQKWTWEIAPAMVGAVIASLTIARLFAGALGERPATAVAADI